MTDSSRNYYSDHALAVQAEYDRKVAAGEPIKVSDIRGIAEARDPRRHAYGSYPTQLSGHTFDGVPFYFRARHGEWELWAPYTRTEEVLVASGDDDTYGTMHADAVDAIITRELGAGWTPKAGA
ncbi:hypothetical protein BH769_gp82 [Gordonia phage BritBrat]|uniref:Uncharacterized protein n=1 Tax=Gordonia phage BritBrat TaxID=1838064 RepID=A0A166Y0Q4_9CAUD|nr:hypothetical protein BH769_gp82 [Gordonia phage BritBrat]ANA85285.1 hypothetical protein PBI_BRITBRAT_82 [Gordonia phage BritBrat]QSL99835.1 hypothetical protein SEA_ODAY_91 [Gordonia phage ODay]